MAVTRWLNPAGLVLAGLCFVLPFVTVSCDAPGGYGHAAPGGTTTYTGIDLVVGGEPAVSPPANERPAAQSVDVALYPQPAAGVVLLLLVAGIGFAVRVHQPRVRRAGVATLTGVAAAALLVNQALVESAVAVKVGNQLGQVLPAGKTLRDYVKTGAGFGLCLLLLVVVAIVNLVGWWRSRPRPALVAEEQRS